MYMFICSYMFLMCVCVFIPAQSPGRLSRKSHVPVSIGINTQGFHVVSQENKVISVVCMYGKISLEALIV